MAHDLAYVSRANSAVPPAGLGSAKCLGGTYNFDIFVFDMCWALTFMGTPKIPLPPPLPNSGNPLGTCVGIGRDSFERTALFSRKKVRVK